ncbi:hypothetical protein AZE42_12391 [Rhizopogon vesiculosus]|uniref:Uncharacterized protein n=1 Tax=Rhizopogon vesiculosus TaxID=180088 RepID=A0A1J8Q247_9AGAM|nr:hypothetical protein AZE42_12391 [Rhizopogon vesiculosus]
MISVQKLYVARRPERTGDKWKATQQQQQKGPSHGQAQASTSTAPPQVDSITTSGAAATQSQLAATSENPTWWTRLIFFRTGNYCTLYIQFFCVANVNLDVLRSPIESPFMRTHYKECTKRKEILKCLISYGVLSSRTSIFEESQDVARKIIRGIRAVREASRGWLASLFEMVVRAALTIGSHWYYLGNNYMLSSLPEVQLAHFLFPRSSCSRLQRQLQNHQHLHFLRKAQRVCPQQA